ncbi:hypothetical protein J27TS8_32940 [Robertmurraya siralis]|uniref:Uncharacterized protein n=1 Tax=Robertmurraya siralis TaxID=77777 RepID=A0A919WKC2_9BACI|nr:hypothetical protein J27TS8_32940 [Robertmurraya siralis]
MFFLQGELAMQRGIEKHANKLIIDLTGVSRLTHSITNSE